MPCRGQMVGTAQGRLCPNLFLSDLILRRGVSAVSKDEWHERGLVVRDGAARLLTMRVFLSLRVPTCVPAAKTRDPPLPPLKHDLAARLAAFQKRMCALQVSRVDGAKSLVEGGAQDALVDQVRHIVEQMVLRDHVSRLERRA